MTQAADPIYHLVPGSVWEQAPPGPYRAASLATEGFIHCSYRQQVERVANQFFANAPDLFLLCIDPDRLASALRNEDPGIGELFPHVYGPISRDAVIDVQAMRRDTAGRWVLD